MKHIIVLSVAFFAATLSVSADTVEAPDYLYTTDAVNPQAPINTQSSTKANLTAVLPSQRNTKSN